MLLISFGDGLYETVDGEGGGIETLTLSPNKMDQTNARLAHRQHLHPEADPVERGAALQPCRLAAVVALRGGVGEAGLRPGLPLCEGVVGVRPNGEPLDPTLCG